VELYFHPEYQKQFIFELIRHLKKLQKFKFNVIFATHSPFILSDIPSQNVLKLNEGISIPDKDGINSFGSNIHDLLADEFFLGNGFMGEFAASKIEKLIQKIKSKEVINESNYNKYLLEINLIGEKVLKYPLLELLEEKREKNKLDNNDLINFYQKQIDKLKNQ